MPKNGPMFFLLCELVFASPFCNGVVKRIFSTVKIIKNKKRTSLSVETLRDLLEIKVEGPPFDEFVARPAVELWWRDCWTTRRVNQQLPRKEYQPLKDIHQLLQSLKLTLKMLHLLLHFFHCIKEQLCYGMVCLHISSVFLLSLDPLLICICIPIE